MFSNRQSSIVNLQSDWLVNPVTNPLFVPVTLALAGALATAGIALLLVGFIRQPNFVLNTAAAGSDNRQSSIANLQSVLWERYRTWAIIGLVFLVALLGGKLATAGAVAFIIWQGGREYAALMKLPASHSRALILSGWLTLTVATLTNGAALGWAAGLTFMGWALFAMLPVQHETSVSERLYPALAGLWGYFYIGWLPSHVVGLEAGALLAVGLGVAFSDVGAFVAGKTIGGRKLAPRLSPNKTWGGVIGNVAGGVIAVALASFALPTLALWQLATLALVIGVGSIAGDLLESLLKRGSGVKDAGTLLPGFGGLLDRIDSLLLVAPLVFYLSQLF
jgi:phosphatidate cytidylyltransferase